MPPQQHRLHRHPQLLRQLQQPPGKRLESVDQHLFLSMSRAPRLRARQLLRRSLFQHGREVRFCRRVLQRLLFLRDELPIRPVHLHRLQFFSTQQTLIAVV